MQSERMIGGKIARGMSSTSYHELIIFAPQSSMAQHSIMYSLGSQILLLYNFYILDFYGSFEDIFASSFNFRFCPRVVHIESRHTGRLRGKIPTTLQIRQEIFNQPQSS
jgi:hypothetical protein